MKRTDRIKKLHSNKWRVYITYFVLRFLVVLTIIAQLLNRNYENVFTCVLTLILFLVPSFIERRLHIDLPDTLQIVILCFIFAAEILGEIREYYLTIPFWDTVLHTINGFLFAAVGFSLVDIMNRDEKISVKLSPFYVAVMAFCFSMTIGVLWEFFEWAVDTILHVDMQKDTVITALNTVSLDPAGHNIPYRISGITDTMLVLADGSTVSMGLGGYLDIGLIDTMTDLLVNFIGAIVFSVIGYFYVKNHGEGKIARKFIPTVKVQTPQPPRQEEINNGQDGTKDV